MASKIAVPFAVLLLRLVTLGLLAASLVIIATDNYTDDIYFFPMPRKYTFKDIYAYRYVLAVAAIGCAYTLLQMPFAAVSIARGKRAVGDNVALLLVFADVVAAMLLATGGAAGLGYTYDAKRYNDRWYHRLPGWYVEQVGPALVARLHHDRDKFMTQAFISTGLMLGATVCAAITIMVCTYSLVK